MRRGIVALACLLVALAAVPLFATGEKEGMAAGSLTVSVPWAGAELEQFLPVVRAFEQREGVTVKYLTYRTEDLTAVLPAQLAAGQALADVVFMADWWIKQNAQYAVDLRDVWASGGGAFIPQPREAGGKVVAVPYLMVAKPGFWYRKSFFTANNLEVPTTWTEFTTLLQSIGGVSGIRNPIATGNGVGWPISDVTEHFLAAFGGADLSRGLTSGSIPWTDARVRSVFTQYLVPLLSAGAFSDPIEWTQAVELWWGGQYGLYFMGNWITGMVQDASDLGVFPLPGAKAIVTGDDTAFIPTPSNNIDLAKRLLTYMLGKDGQTLRAQQGGKLVIRNDVPASTYPAADQAVAGVVASMQTTLADMDDTIGGDWQPLFWDQLKLLWVEPGSLNDMLTKLQGGMPKPAM